jgi:MFS family permease
MRTSGSARSWVPAAAAVSTAAWGVNQFAPLSVVYRTDAHWPAVSVVAMFSTYVLGFVPGVLLGGPLSERRGRRIVRPALALSAIASATLALAMASQIAVYASRAATGVAAGIILSAGAAWLKDLSASPDAGARRARYASGGGFAAGALMAGVMAQWLPDPMVFPCVVQALLALLVLVATRKVPETAPGIMYPRLRGLRRTAARDPRFLRVVLPASPAVFVAATVAYVVLPPLVANQVRGYAPLFSGLATALAVAMGIAAQPLAVWLDHSGSARATLVGMVTVIAGLLLGALAVYQNSAALVLAAASLLGAGYGLTLASGLNEIERLAPSRALSSAASVYHGASSIGLLTPLVLAIAAGAAPYPALLVGLALVGMLCLAITARHSRRHLPEPVRRHSLPERMDSMAE